MSTIKARVQEDMKTAMKAGEALRLSTVRMALSELKRFESDKGTEADDPTSMGIIEKMIKQRHDSESQFRSGNRP